MKVVCVNSMEKIFPDVEPKLILRRASVFGNERYNFQFAVLSEKDVSAEFSLSANGREIPTKLVKSVPSQLSKYLNVSDDFVIFKERASTYYPDLLLPLPDKKISLKKDCWTQKVLEEFVAAGAPEEIMYLGKPHIGTDKLSYMVGNLRRKILSLGGEYRFETRLTDLIVKNGRLAGVQVVNAAGETEEIAADSVILAVGHSARDTFEMLYNKGVQMVQKPFAVGARIEHPQKFINKSQYGVVKPRRILGAADYKLAVHLDNGRSLYTFCMCPGGTVVAAASEAGRLVTNGMSEYARDKNNANSALLVDVTPADFGSDHPLAGVEFQRKIEENAFKAGGGLFRAPVQRVVDFLRDKETVKFGEVTPSYLPGVAMADMRAVLPDFVIETMKAGFKKLDRKIRSFSAHDAILTAAETRTSSPIRMIRNPDTLQSVSIEGLYPCGEGAGYAGGIMSAAVDGLKCAHKILSALE